MSHVFVCAASSGISGAFTLSSFPSGEKRIIGPFADLHLDHLSEMVRVNNFMEGLRMGAAKMEALCFHPSTFEKAVNVALNAEFNCKEYRYVTQWNIQRSLDKADPMYLSHVVEEAELQAAEQQRSIRRCYMSGYTRHIFSLAVCGKASTA